MRTALRVGVRPSISGLEIDCQQSSPNKFFGSLAEFLWPKPNFKADYELHIRTGASDRMCRYWIEGKHPPSSRAQRALLGEILKRLG